MPPDYMDIEDIGDSILICKSLWQHAWQKNPSPKHIDGQIARLAYTMLCLRCTRCRRERYDYLGVNGERIARPYYRDPVGYPRVRRSSGDALRAEMIRRELWVQKWAG